MSEIKSYLSLESVPSLQFKTPAKNVMQTLTTNNSMAFSHTMGSTDNKSQWNRRTFYNSQDLFKQPIYQNRDFVEEQSAELENNSSALTLSPAITPADIAQLANAIKMVSFLAGRNQQALLLIESKTKAINTLRNKVYLQEERVKFLKQRIENQEKVIKSRSRSIRKQKQAVSNTLRKDIIDMKLNINQLKRTLSIKGKRQTIETQRLSNEKRKSQRQVATERHSRERIYMPLASPFFASPLAHHRHSSHSDYHPPPNCIHTQEVIHRTPPIEAMRSSQSNTNSKHNDSKKVRATPQLEQQTIFDLIQQKINQPSQAQKSHRISANNSKVQRQNPQITVHQPPQSNILNMIGPALKQDIKSHLEDHKIKMKEDKPNLDYFKQSFEEEIKLDDEMLRQSHQSRKSIKALKQSTKTLSNKWRKDEDHQDDLQIVNLLEKSINAQAQPQLQPQPQPQPQPQLQPQPQSLPQPQPQPQPPNQQPPRQPSPKAQHQQPQKQSQPQTTPLRSEMGAKLVKTNIIQHYEDSFNVDLPEFSRQHHNKSSNASRIEVFVETSDDKIKNESVTEDKRASAKNIDRQDIVNSEIGIKIEFTDSIEDLPSHLEENQHSTRKTGLALPGNMEKIQEKSEYSLSRANTPVDIHNLEPSVESGYFPTPRDNPLITSESSLEKSAPHTPPLSRPPSLIEQQEEDEDDIIDSIKLATNSRYSSDNTISKLQKPSHIEHPNNQKTPSHISQTPSHIHDEPDLLDDIQLTGMSKISRERIKNDSVLKEDIDSIPEVSPSKMAQSELAPSSLHPLEDGMDVIDSELRKSTNSVIVKKGNSAIQRSGARRESTASIKTSNRGSSLTAKSGDISAPIQEADEQEEEYSAIIKQHKRSATDAQQMW